MNKANIEKTKEVLEDLRATINHGYCGEKEYNQVLALQTALELFGEYEDLKDLLLTRDNYIAELRRKLKTLHDFSECKELGIIGKKRFGEIIATYLKELASCGDIILVNKILGWDRIATAIYERIEGKV